MSDPLAQQTPPKSTAGGRTISVILSTTMGEQEWDIDVPVDKPVGTIKKKMLAVAKVPIVDNNGVPQTYQLQWKEKNRYLLDGETMDGAGVQPRHTLVLAYEARAGAQSSIEPAPEFGAFSLRIVQ